MSGSGKKKDGFGYGFRWRQSGREHCRAVIFAHAADIWRINSNEQRASASGRPAGQTFGVLFDTMAEPLKLPEDKEPVLRVLPMPADANHHGDIFGGWIMAQVDLAGGILAGRHARGRVATVAVNSFQFKQAVQIGDLLSFYAEIVRVGNTSITINVEVYAQRNPEEIEIVKVTEATLTYVATDKNRRPRPVAPLPAKRG